FLNSFMLVVLLKEYVSQVRIPPDKTPNVWIVPIVHRQPLPRQGKFSTIFSSLFLQYAKTFHPKRRQTD
ncbi:MAG: hypothetical protein ACI4LE_06635, partial [Faecalibacterium sp.]